MNKRMLELYKQAQVPHTAIDPSNNMPYETTCFSAEKFAELIVRECEKVAKGGSWYYDAPSCGWRNPINHVCNEMKQHFGVEDV